MSVINEQQLSNLIPKNTRINEWCAALNDILPKYDITTPARIAAFIAQCAHESGGFQFLQENLNYRAASLRKVFPKYFPDDATANDYASRPNKQEAIANRIYANRMGNGNEASGDGWRYRGRGAIQLTGRNNYAAFAKSIGKSLEETVAYLETIPGAVESAAWFWKNNNLNREADARDIKTMTRKINGGFIGLEDRIKHYEHALHVLEG